MCKYCKVDDYTKAIISKTINILNAGIGIELWLNGHMLTLSSGDDCVTITKKKNQILSYMRQRTN